MTIKATNCPLYGLVLAGGHSRRMGRDKTKFLYHGKPQMAYLYELLNTITQKKAYVSCRSNQVGLSAFKDFDTIEDQKSNLGPVGGILSAFDKYPDVAWLVTACDMPFIDQQAIEYLIRKRNPYKTATCFYNKDKQWPEPLCTIYEPKSALCLKRYLAMGYKCPRKILMNVAIQTIEPPFAHLLK